MKDKSKVKDLGVKEYSDSLMNFISLRLKLIIRTGAPGLVLYVKNKYSLK